MSLYLALDAGGTSTRATVLRPDGSCLGFGISGPGNPISSGFARAISSLTEASSQALASLPAAERSFDTATLAIAGGSLEMPVEKIRAALAPLGLQAKAMIESDLLAMYFSGTYHSNGFAMISGTGAICARVLDSEVDRISDGLGWLIGDDGSGYWLGQAAVRAVAAALDGRGPDTLMVASLLERLGIPSRNSSASGNPALHSASLHRASSHRVEPAGEPAKELIRGPWRAGRPVHLQSLLQTVYALRPIQLAAFATVVFDAAAENDQVAVKLLDDAANLLLHSLSVVWPAAEQATGTQAIGAQVTGTQATGTQSAADQLPGNRLPVVLGGSILRHGSPVGNAVERGLPGADIIRVADGLAGAAALALRRAGIAVGPEVFARIKTSLDRLRA